jgi:heme exporter protein D
MMRSLVDFLAMGGYAAFVWPAYAAAAAIMTALCWTSLSSYRRNSRALVALQAARPPRQRAA